MIGVGVFRAGRRAGIIVGRNIRVNDCAVCIRVNCRISCLHRRFADGLQNRDISGQRGQRKQERRQHKHRRRTDCNARQNRLRAARSESRAGDVAGKQRAGIGFARLQ